MDLEFSRKIFEKYSNKNFHKNLSSGSRIVQSGRTESSVVLTTPPVSTIPTLQNPLPKAKLLVVVIIKTTDDEISPSLHSRIDLVNTDTLSDETLMMAGIGRNM